LLEVASLVTEATGGSDPNWNDPAARNRLIERVGPEEYDRLHAEQTAGSTVAIVNGHAIRKVQSRFGKLYQVGTTGTAFSAFEAAKTFASKKKGANNGARTRAQVSCRA
jgi:hypothetical protein